MSQKRHTICSLPQQAEDYNRVPRSLIWSNDDATEVRDDRSKKNVPAGRYAIFTHAELGFKAGDEVVIKRIAGANVFVKKNLSWDEFNAMLDGSMENFDVSSEHEHSHLPEKRYLRKEKDAPLRKWLFEIQGLEVENWVGNK